MNIYDFSAKTRDGSEEQLSVYKGKVLLVVNTATACGFTPQYKELQEIYDKYKDKGFAILDFPCNQFGEQAKGSDEEIHSFCTGRFGITFPQYAKIDVNGDAADPIYKWLTDNSTFEGFDKSPTGLMMGQILKKIDPDYKNNSKIKWNFTKFLIDKNGNVAERFEPMTSLKKICDKIDELI